MGAYLRYFFAQRYKIPEYGRFVYGIPQQSGRVIGGHEQRTVLVKKFAVIPGNGKAWIDKLLGSDAPQAYDDLRTQQLELLPEPWQAG